LDSRQFLIAIKRLADSLSYGTDRSPFLGSGQEFVQSRPYVAGDPIKSIDWRVTARTNEFFVKEYEAPKRMPAYLLIDTSASMTISSIERSKYAVAVHLAGGLALACLDRVSPVGILSVGDNGMHVPPSLSKDQILQWLHRLRHFRYDEPTTLSSRLAELVPSLNSRCLMIVISDMHDSSAVSVLKRVNQQHDCCVLQLRDPAERGFSGAGLLRAREAESGRAFVTRTRNAWVDQDHIRNELKRSGVDHLLIDTDVPFVHSLRHFFAARGLVGRGAR
jgi:uncharacterized protein (DUF58 family)